jgi:hypothetical protein
VRCHAGAIREDITTQLYFSRLGARRQAAASQRQQAAAARTSAGRGFVNVANVGSQQQSV